ncbi:hypothetical protein Leryth_004344 [Lithospermum erythrorhizon]|nr:hypothetical protein Leryth_004344 [Lithospermum erythrorhizon]
MDCGVSDVVRAMTPEADVKCDAGLVKSEEKLVPIYGRGKSSVDPRHRLVPGVDIPNRPAGQRPQTTPHVDINYFRQDELDPGAGYSPMAAARFGNLTLSALFGAIPSFFNLQVHGFHDATVYGATTGVPYMFSSSFHGGYVHGFNHSLHVEGTRFMLKMLLLILGFLLIMLLIG